MKLVRYLFLGLALIAAPGIYAMEKEQGVSLSTMPAEIKVMIINQVANAGSFDEAIDSLRALSLTNKEFNMWIKDPFITRQIVELLVHKFNMPQMTFEYATEDKIGWNKEAVEEYFELGEGLIAEIEYQNEEMVEKLLQKGADSNFYFLLEKGQFTFELTPLLFAGQKESKKLVELLLQYGANTNFETSKGLTPLLLAIGRGDVQLVELLLKYGADPNFKNIHNTNALNIVVARYPNVEIIKLLLNYGAVPSEKDIAIAQHLGYQEIERLLKEALEKKS